MKYLFTLLSIVISCSLFAATYYSDPISGSMTNPGTSAFPWSNLEDVMNSSNTFVAGDIIICRDGNHGFPKVNGVNSGYVNVQAEVGHTPTCTRIYFGSTSSASFWKFSGITFELENTAPSPLRLVEIFANCDHITIENCNLRSSTNTVSWTRNDWRTKACTGIWARGSGHIIQNCTVENVAIGIINDASFTLVNNNTIENFTIDGIRGNGDDSQYNENLIQNNIIVYTYAENHYDGFQAFTTDTIKNVLFRKNTIICTTDTTRAFRGSMQGMGCFDGFYQNWTIENNLIITDHWHGITLLGALNCRVVNNTVIDNYLNTPVDPLDPQSLPVYGPAWIKIAAHKNGQPSSGNYIGNNICNAMQNDIGIGTVTNNLLIPSMSDYANHFIDAPNNQFQLLSSSTAVDYGSNQFAPATDIIGISRPQGLAIDAGAYEYACSVSLTLVSSNHSVCEGDSSSVSASGSFISVSWNNSVVDGQSFYPAASDYYVASATDGSCTVTDSLFIEVNDLPLVTFQFNDSTVCFGDSVELNSTSVTNPGGGSFSGSAIANGYLHSSAIGSNDQATYSYTDSNGCSASASDVILVIDCSVGVENEPLKYKLSYQLDYVLFELSTALTSYEVIDINGRLVFKSDSKSNQIMLNESDFESGIYLVRMWKGNDASVAKVKL